MKITYEFDNGDVVIVEASERIGKWILASRRREASDDSIITDTVTLWMQLMIRAAGLHRMRIIRMRSLTA